MGQLYTASRASGIPVRLVQEKMEEGNEILYFEKQVRDWLGDYEVYVLLVELRRLLRGKGTQSIFSMFL